VVLNVKVSRHGPIVNDLIEGLQKNKPVALSWIYSQQPIFILDAVYALSHSKNKEEFQKGVQLIAAPGLNVMYGDAKGNVAWWAAGKLYNYNSGVNPNFILDGPSGKDDIKEYLDFSKNPSSVNPSCNYVYSANNQPEAIDGYLYPGYYLPEDRAKRIVHLLDSKSNWDKESASKMIFDNTSSVAPSVVINLIQAVDLKALSKTEKEAISILKDWKGSSNLEDIAPTVYNKWIYCSLKNTFQDEMGDKNFKQFLETHIVKQVVARQIENKKSLWWDNIATKNVKETHSQILTKSLKEAIAALEKQLGKSVKSWTWNKVHTLEHHHP
jgi:penicillin amidase